MFRAGQNFRRSDFDRSWGRLANVDTVVAERIISWKQTTTMEHLMETKEPFVDLPDLETKRLRLRKLTLETQPTCLPTPLTPRSPAI
jgi:hypothetical protein